MGKVSTVTDKKTEDTYTISTVKNDKKVFINKHTFHTVYEAALLKGRWPKTKTRKPLCVFELIDIPQAGLSLDDFHEKITKLANGHSPDELLSPEGSALYESEGFYSYASEKWQLLTTSKVKMVFLAPKDSITAIPFRKATVGEQTLAWDVFHEVMNDILKQKIREMSGVKRGHYKNLAEEAHVMAVFLMNDALEATQGVTKLADANETLELVPYFETYLAMLLHETDRWVTGSRGDDNAETYMLAMHDTILRTWEAYAAKVQADKDATSEIINHFLALCNDISEEFNDEKLYDYDPETAMKGSWPFEAGRRLGSALYGEDKGDLEFMLYLSLSNILTQRHLETLKFVLGKN